MNDFKYRVVLVVVHCNILTNFDYKIWRLLLSALLPTRYHYGSWVQKHCVMVSEYYSEIISFKTTKLWSSSFFL